MYGASSLKVLSNQEVVMLMLMRCVNVDKKILFSHVQCGGSIFESFFFFLMCHQETANEKNNFKRS